MRDARGFDFTGYKRSSIRRRVYRRMQVVSAGSLSEYRALLEADVDEFTALFNTILINLTGFFRDPGSWRYLAEEVVPAIVAAHGPDEEIRIWSAGCATGEEPYSLAMTMAEHLGDTDVARRVKIYATDIDLEALAMARLAIFTEKAVAAVPQDLRSRYFHTDLRGHGLVLDSRLRRIVIFGRHDLTRDPPISHVDLLACRNTLMYLNAETQAFVIPRLHYALRDGGYLFLGRAEMVHQGGAGRFAPVSMRHRIFVALEHPTVVRDATEVRVTPRRPFDLGPFEAPPLDLYEAPPLGSALRPLSEAAFQTGPVAELLVDPNGVLRGANDAARAMFAVDADALGLPLRQLSIAASPVDLVGAIARALSEVASQDVGVQRFSSPDGGDFDAEIHVLPMVDESGALLGASVTFTDVSGTVELRDQYRRMREELETAYEELQSTNEELVTSNEELQSSYEELETSNEELQSSNEELETTNEELRSANEELEATNLELKRASDATHDLNSTLVDANSRLRRYSTLHRRVLDNLPSAVVLLNASLIVEEWNDASTELWGLRSDEAVGEPFFGLSFGLPLEMLQAPVRACRGAEAAAVEVQIDAVNRLGRPITCRVSVVPVSDSETGASAMLVMDASPREPG